MTRTQNRVSQVREANPGIAQSAIQRSYDVETIILSAKLVRSKIVILSAAKNPNTLHRTTTAHPFQPRNLNQLRDAKLIRSKTVILDEAKRS